MGLLSLLNARLRFSSNVKITFDGNSLVAGTGASGSTKYLPAQLYGLPPVSSAASMNNIGIGGQTWEGMTSDHSDVDASFDASKTNILIAWETSNSITNSNDSAATAYAAAQAYINAVLAVHPGWKIVLMTTIPRQAGAHVNNQALVDCDNLFRQNYKAMGAKALCDVRAGSSPWNFTGYTTTDFTTGPSVPYWFESSPNIIHLNDAGYLVVANMLVNTLRRLNVR